VSIFGGKVVLLFEYIQMNICSLTAFSAFLLLKGASLWLPALSLRRFTA
jgi:hypothetical protein